jgi:hypothetical protein
VLPDPPAQPAQLAQPVKQDLPVQLETQGKSEQPGQPATQETQVKPATQETQVKPDKQEQPAQPGKQEQPAALDQQVQAKQETQAQPALPAAQAQLVPRALLARQESPDLSAPPAQPAPPAKT